MKNLKKLLVLALVIAAVMAIGITAFAAGPTISVDATDNHTYDVFQIFTGDLSEGILSNVVLGANGQLPEGEELADALAALENISSTASDSAKLAAILPYVNLKSTPVSVDKDNSYAAAPGYYLIKDTADYKPAVDENGNEIEAYTKYIVKVVGDVKISRKADGVPTSDKVIVENGQDVKVNEAAIGDTVTYKITGTIPAAAAEYDYYYFILNDTMEAGLTYKSISSVTVGTTILTEGTGYTLKTGDDADPYTFQLALTDAKTYAGQTVTVICTAEVNEDAEIIGESNDNTVNLTYSNNSNFTYDGTNEQNNPGFPDSTKKVPTGETPDSKVETYVTELTLTKVDDDENPLTGAEFQLTGDTTKVIVNTYVTYVEAAEDEVGEYYLLNDNTYTTEAPTAEYMEQIGMIGDEGLTAGYVRVLPEDDVDSFEGVITVNEIQYRPYNPTEDIGNIAGPVFRLVESNIDLYATPVEAKYVQKTGATVGADTEYTDIKAFVGADGTMKFTGLGVGEYTLTETTTPAGYNTIAPIDFEITFDPDTKKFSASSPVEGDTVLTITVQNNKGAELPETGGMGTTIFYVIGALLVLAAGVLLITKKRMSVNA